MSKDNLTLEQLSIIESYRPLLHKVVSRRVPKDFVEDVVQESLRRAVLGLHKLRDQRALGSWLVKVAANAVADFYQKRNKVSETSAGNATTEVLTTPQADSDFHRSYNRLMYQQIVHLLMDRLDADDKRLIELFYFDELAHKEIAEQFKVSERNIGVRLHRLRSKLRKLLAQHHDSVEIFGRSVVDL